MTKKDFISQENTDREQQPHRGEDRLSYGNEQTEKHTKQTYVKNAHAAGDGAFGRNETGVPEDEGNPVKLSEDPAY